MDQQLSMWGGEDRLGSRGGVTRSLEEGQALIEDHKADEARFVRESILRVALRSGEVHADDLSGLEVSSPNVIGAQINALARSRLLEKLNRRGAVEHRKARAKASHGRASYVWRLTDKGRRQAERLR